MHRPRACSFSAPGKRNGRPSLEARGGRKSALKGRGELLVYAATGGHGTPGEGGAATWIEFGGQRSLKRRRDLPPPRTPPGSPETYAMTQGEIADALSTVPRRKRRESQGSPKRL